METDYNQSLERSKANKEIKDKKKFMAISFCILISISLWLLIKFSDDYQFSVQIPIYITNIPQDRILINKDTIVLTSNIKTQGFNAIYYHFFNKKGVVRIDYSTLKFKENDKNTNLQFNTSQLTKLIEKQMKFNCEISSLYPESISLNFEKTYFKIVPIKLNSQLHFDDQYMLYDSIKLVPDKICISGTEKAIKSIDHLTSELIVLNNLNSDQNISANIVKPENNIEIKIPIDKIKINIPVEKFTESSIEVPINISNENRKLKLKLFPDKVKITYMVALKDFKKVSKELFDVEVNDNINKSDENNKLKVDLVKSPAFIKVTKIYPDNVEYIIYK